MDNPQERDAGLETPTNVAVEETLVPEASTTEGASPVAEPAAAQSKKQLIASLVIGALLIGGAGYYVYSEYYAGGGVVAVVNGKDISQKELDESMKVVEQNPEFYGIDATSPDAEKQKQDRAMDILVNNALLITAAQKAGFSVEDEDIQATYDELVTQLGSEEVLKTEMAAVGLTKRKLRSNIRDRELVNKYLESEIPTASIEVTEEEVDGFIKSLEDSNVALPEDLEEVRASVKAEILNQKQQQLINVLLTRLKEEAVIDIRI